MTGLQIALGLHVVIHLVEIVIQFLAIEDVLFLEARNQPGFFDIFHLIAQLTALEDLAAFKLNFGHTNASSFGYLKGNRDRSCRHVLPAFGDSGIGMTFGRQQFFQHPHGVANLDRIIDSFFRNSDAPLAESLQYV